MEIICEPQRVHGMDTNWDENQGTFDDIKEEYENAELLLKKMSGKSINRLLDRRKLLTQFSHFVLSLKTRS